MKNWMLLTLAMFFSFVGMAQPPQGDVQAGDDFGDVSSIKMLSIHTDVSAIGEEDALEGTFKGKVFESCVKKGCWVKLEMEDGNTVFVKSKDHAFYVPESIVGKTVLVSGEAQLNVSSVAHLQHIAEDAGKSKEEIEAITEPEKEYKIMAVGLRVLD